MGRFVVVTGMIALMLSGCMAPDGSGDRPTRSDGLGGVGGKADQGSSLDGCALEQTVSWINGLRTSRPDTDAVAEALRDRGVYSLGARRIAQFLDGADGELGTEDDDPFDDRVGSSWSEHIGGGSPAPARGEPLPGKSGQAQPGDGYPEGVAELDHVDWVGRGTIATLARSMRGRCSPSRDGELEVIFSPAAVPESHVARAVELIRGAEHAIDIAMYSFSAREPYCSRQQDAEGECTRPDSWPARGNPVMDALEGAVDRGVSVRFVFNKASEHESDPEGTTSARLEELGAEVRWVNVTMHHKFMLVDGPRGSYVGAEDAPSEQEILARADGATLLSGSGNWSGGAVNRYDENTLVARGIDELNLRFQREFNHMWEWSRPVEWNEDIEPVREVEITDSDIEDRASVDALFTSDNFEPRIYAGRPTFSTDWEAGTWAIADRMVQKIEQAEERIWIASGHMRSRRIAEALLRKHARDPDMDIRIYLDEQEHYWSRAVREELTRRLGEDWSEDQVPADVLIDAQRTVVTEGLGDEGDDGCEVPQSEASSESEWSCHLTGTHYADLLDLAGMDVRYKVYSRYFQHWYPQMHHKYLLVDDTVISGSYNLSYNAAFETLENSIVLDGEAYPRVLRSFEDNFSRMWDAGRAEAHEALRELIQNDAGLPIPMIFDSAFFPDGSVFERPAYDEIRPMSLTGRQYTELRWLLNDHCVSGNYRESTSCSTR